MGSHIATVDAITEEKVATAPATSLSDGPEFILASAPHRVGRVSLVVHDLERVSEFYQSVLGLRVVEEVSGRVRLGTSSSVLLELAHEPAARLRNPQEAGLFHTAFLLPRRDALGAWLSHAAAAGVRLTGAADHLVSEAVYLNDPEGNGIEIYVDRPSGAWSRAGGMIEMSTDPLDLDGLVKASTGTNWSGFPEAGVVGHVHLQVGDLAAADAFYRDLLGFELTTRYPGASFYGSGGYHHQLAGNIWNSRGAPERTDVATGLAEVELLADEEVLEALRSKPLARKHALGPDGISLRDPWGTSISLREARPEKMKGE
ncbi:VOC family protein [Sphingomonas sp. LY54]|uniref:VOC family protein n=1 Tax=Sphingomonas sp. LY54 TaxID=3095343 RepID=UPI002D77E114|nr:VOC family protein [Sphingomonas sp. LY54]WRP27743.1 VOC family protein [Sphingomonas sp. LY54]